MVPGGRAEVPDPRLTGACEQAVANQLVAGPLADDRGGDVADIVLVEDEKRAQPRARQGLARPADSIRVQAAEVHALLEVHLHAARRLDGPVPAVVRVEGVRRSGLHLASGRLLCHVASRNARLRALGQFTSPYFVASGPATLNVHPRTPRAAGPLAPRLARNLPQCLCPTVCRV